MKNLSILMVVSLDFHSSLMRETCPFILEETEPWSEHSEAPASGSAQLSFPSAPSFTCLCFWPVLLESPQSERPPGCGGECLVIQRWISECEASQGFIVRPCLQKKKERPFPPVKDCITHSEEASHPGSGHPPLQPLCSAFQASPEF